MPAAELYEHIKADDAASDDTPDIEHGVEYEIVNPEGRVVVRTNQHIVDDAASQKLSLQEIEALKQGETSSGKDVIAKILESHSSLDKKTSFALAKYTLRKRRKFLKRFTVLPLDVPLLTSWMVFEKDPHRTMEIREESLALACSWANVHRVENSIDENRPTDAKHEGDNRWLVVDETGGLMVAAMAERMGILYHSRSASTTSTLENGISSRSDQVKQEEQETSEALPVPAEDSSSSISSKPNPSIFAQETAMSATTNSITMIHPNPQPNISLLQYFGYDLSQADPSHPLHTNLRTLTWLQLLHPTEDAAYQEPQILPDSELYGMKSSKKGTYHRKRRRWLRTKMVVDQTRAGDFVGIIIASFMDPVTVLHHTVPLLRGGAQVVVYSPAIEPLEKLIDCYSKLRRAAYMNTTNPEVPSEEFPVNPLLLLAPTVYSARARPWQVLPGRTHPKMTGRGGAEGYVFTATRVFPLAGDVKARGTFKKRKVDAPSSTQQSPSSEEAMEE